MADQAAPQTVADTGEQGVSPQVAYGVQEHQEFHGRPASWAVTVIVFIGFALGGAALPLGPTWWLFWVGCGIVVIGAIMGAVVRIFDDWY